MGLDRPAQRSISISRTILLSMILSLAFSMLIVGYFWISYVFERFDAEAENEKNAYIESQKTLIKNEVLKAVDSVTYRRSQAEHRLKQQLRSRTHEAYAIAINLYRENRATRSDADIMKLIKDALRPLRFNSDRGYFFIIDNNGVARLYPPDPSLEGTSMLELRDIQGKYLIKAAIRIAGTQGEGFNDYHWHKPGAPERKEFPKISFVKRFEPYDWIIGCGEYLDDITRDVQNEILERIARIRFGQDGYIFVVSYNGVTLMNDTQRHLIGKNIWELTDPNGVKVIQEERRAVENPEGDFIYYVWNRPTESKPAAKISFMKGIPDWEWMIGAGVYVDAIDSVIAAKRAVLQKDVRKQIATILFIIMLLLAAIFIFAKFIAAQLRKNFDIFFAFFKAAVEKSAKIDSQKLRFSELQSLSLAANTMIDNLAEAEQRLRASEEKYRELVENANSIIIRWKPTGEITFFNEFAQRFFGYTEQELLGKNLIGTIVPEMETSGRNLKTMLEDIAREPEKYYFNENENICRDGRRAWIAWTNKAIKDDRGTIIELFSVGTDITQRKQAEEQMARLMSAVQQASETVTIIDPDGTILYANPAVEKTTGYALQDVVGKNFHDLAFDKQLHAEVWEIVTKGDAWSGHIRAQTKQGAFVNIEVAISPVRNQQGTITGFVAIGRDITHELAMEEQLRQTQKMEAIGTLAGGIAHDFNNILGGIIGYTEVLDDRIPENNPDRKYLDEIFKLSLRASDLVKQILTFSRKTQEERKPLLIHPIVKEAVKLIRSTIPTTIAISQHIDEASGMAKADPVHIHQIVVNLCTNAAHAMRQHGGVMDISLSPVVLTEEEWIKNAGILPGMYIRLRISDTGTGIDPGILHRIFDPFFTTKQQGEGTGMGLAVVHGIVKNYGGHITAESLPGRGTTFTVWLPQVTQAPGIQEESLSALPTGSERILFIDDEPCLIEAGRKMLTALGYTVTAINSSLEACELFQKAPDCFDLIITDHSMPHMTGYDLAKKLLAIRPSLPVILCTGYSETVSPDEAIAAGIRAFFYKPVKKNEMAKTIRELLDKRFSRAP